MKKIVFVMDAMIANGAQRVMSLLVNKAAESGIEAILVLVSKNTIEYEISEKAKIIDLTPCFKGKGRIPALIARLKALRRLFKMEKPDVIVSFLTVYNIYSVIMSRGLNIPVIVSERADPNKMGSRFKKRLRDFSYAKAEGMIFQTEYAKNAFKKKIRDKGVVIPNPVKDNLPISERKSPEKKIAAAGRLAEQKNYPMMLKAFSAFNKQYPEYELHIYGEGADKKSLEDLAKALGISEKVVFEGLVTDLHERIKNYSMYLLSSDFEGISNSLLEALAMGLPSVSTDCPVGGSRLLISDGENGLLTPVGDHESFAKAMCKIAASKEFADKLSENALKVREKYSSDLIIKEYLDYILSKCGEKDECNK